MQQPALYLVKPALAVTFANEDTHEADEAFAFGAPVLRAESHNPPPSLAPAYAPADQ